MTTDETRFWLEMDIDNVLAALDDQTDEIKVAKLYERLDQLKEFLKKL